MGDTSFDVRFTRNLESLGVGDRPLHLLVAFSGGLDSTVLLHLLRFRAHERRLRVTAAHFDHRMRASSEADAAWVRGICLAWGVPLEQEVATGPLRSERDARDARYGFLTRAAARVGADRIVTAHHADDQAETVLFRVLRGTGLAGLGGIPRRTASGLLRPLLPFWREELEEYAREAGLRWRTDPTNVTCGPVRNRIRLNVLPAIEREVSGAARHNLVALAALARESEAGWRSIVGSVYPRVVSVDGDAVVVVREALREYHPAIGTRVLRRALRRFGIVLDRAGTRSALKFITHARSGREMHLPGGVRIRIEFGRARIDWGRPPAADETLEIHLRQPGEVFTGEVAFGGSRFRVDARFAAEAASPPASAARWAGRIEVEPDRFPLLVRSRRSGDRVRTHGGTKSLKKLMIEQRIPVSERSSRPILVDVGGRIVWVAGLEVTSGPTDSPGSLALDLTIINV